MHLMLFEWRYYAERVYRVERRFEVDQVRRDARRSGPSIRLNCKIDA